MRMQRRLAGHALAFEGAPHDDQGHRIGWSGVAGFGRAKCSCGELSEEFPSGARRRLWHIDHKNDLRVAEYVASNPGLPWITPAPADRACPDDPADVPGEVSE